MTSLVQVGRDGQAVTSSLKVSEVFGKNHFHILEAIRKIIDESQCIENSMHLTVEFWTVRCIEFSMHLTVQNSTVKEWYAESEYTDEKKRQKPCYIMTQQGFALLAMGFTGAKAMKFKIQYIQEFERMRKFITEYQQAVKQVEFQNPYLMLDEELPAYTISGYARYKGYRFDSFTAAMYGKRATKLSKELGVPIRVVSDPRFGKVNLYRTEILREAFKQPIM